MTLDEDTQLLGQLAGAPVRPFMTYSYGMERDPSARSVIVPKKDAERLLGQIRHQLPAGLIGFIGSTRWLGEEQPDGVEIVVAKGASQFESLRLARCQSQTVDNTEQLIAKLSEYDQAFGINILHCETGTVEFELKSLPDDMDELCRDLWNICEDILSTVNGVDDQDALLKLARHLRAERRVLLEWD